MLAESIIDGLQKLGDGVLIVAVVCFGMMVVGVTTAIARAWRRVRETESRTALVGMMLQRGMSAADIERIMSTCLDREGEDGAEVENQKPDVRIIALMKENEYEGDDIERILDAARTNGVIDADTVKVIETLVEQGAEAEEIEGILDARRPPSPNRVAV